MPIAILSFTTHAYACVVGQVAVVKMAQKMVVQTVRCVCRIGMEVRSLRLYEKSTDDDDRTKFVGFEIWLVVQSFL